MVPDVVKAGKAEQGSRDSAAGRPDSRERVLDWRVSAPPPRELERDGWFVLRFGQVARRAEALRPRGTARSSLRNPAAELLAVYARHEKVAVLDVTCRSVGDLRLLLGLVVEPAFRAGCRLLVAAAWTPAALDPAGFDDKDWGCPWTLERLRYLAAVYAVSAVVPAPPPPPGTGWRRLARRLWCRVDASSPWAPRLTPPLAPRLDPEQNAAVAAGDGVVQVIAPAGSGKTTVLVERVRELKRRGTASERILCSTFNRDACVEIAARLAKAGIPGIGVRSFHGLGLSILREEGRLRGDLGTTEDATWRALAAAAAAAEPGAGRLDPATAQNAVSLYKLKLMVMPDEALARAAKFDGPRAARARMSAHLYAQYEEHLRRSGRLDFDDLIFASIRLLQEDARVRDRWQSRYERVLVDEYQDIEPAQALLIGLLAAPHDSLFCVGDEDQCIYAWRRAAVQRVIELDQTYPGLERYPLVRNYRCGRDITHASRRLIRHNRQRFNKPLHAGVRDRGRILAWPQPDPRAVPPFAAAMLAAAAGEPGSVAVLARTGRLLTAVTAAGGPSLAARVEAGAVELATVHGSKGREWDRVILVGADQGQFPLARTLRAGAGAGGGVEDERRLFYVALTRAKRRLDVVFTRGKASQFLREAGIRAR